MDLAAFQVSLREQETGLSTQQADQIIKPWDGLTMFDKSLTRFSQRFTSSPGPGMRSKKEEKCDTWCYRYRELSNKSADKIWGKVKIYSPTFIKQAFKG